MSDRRYKKPKTSKKPKQQKNASLNSQLTSQGKELKYLVVAAATNANSGGNLVVINAVTKGTTENQRVGKIISLRRIVLRGFMSVTPATGVDQVHRHMLVWDRFPYGAAPGIADILLAITTYSFPDPVNARRFNILYDHTTALNASAESGSIHPISLDINIRRNVFFNANAFGDTRDILCGAIYLVVIGSSAAGATAGSFNWNSCVYFTDD